MIYQHSVLKCPLDPPYLKCEKSFKIPDSPKIEFRESHFCIEFYSLLIEIFIIHRQKLFFLFASFKRVSRGISSNFPSYFLSENQLRNAHSFFISSPLCFGRTKMISLGYKIWQNIGQLFGISFFQVFSLFSDFLLMCQQVKVKIEPVVRLSTRI